MRPLDDLPDRVLRLAVLFAVTSIPIGWSPVAAQGDAVASGDTLAAFQAAALPVDLAPYRSLIAARQRLADGETEEARAALAPFAKARPGFAPAALAAARLDARGDARHLPRALRAALEAVRASWPLQAVLLNRACWWLGGMLLIAVTLLVAARVVSLLAPLHHLIYERLRPARSERLAGAGAAIVLALPLAWGLGPLGVGLVLLALGSRGNLRGDRALLMAGTAVILVLTIGPGLAPTVLEAPVLHDDATILASAQHGTLTPAAEERLEALSETLPLADLVRGQALRRSGDSRGARAVLARYVERQPDDTIGHIALGNAHWDSGAVQRAATEYENALRMAPEDAVASYNLSIAFARMLRFEDANRLMARASKLDFATVSTGGGSGAATPLAPLVPTSRFWSVAADTGAPRGIASPYVVRMLLPWNGGPLWPLFAVALALAFMVRRRLWRRLATFECSICGRQVCRRCVRRSRSRIFCRSCAEQLGDIPSDQLLQVLAAGRRRRRARRLGPGSLILVCLLPGYGLVRKHRPFLAVLCCLLCAGGVMAFALGAEVVLMPPAPTVFRIGFGHVLALATIVTGLGSAIALGLTVKPRDLEHSVRGRLVPMAGPVRGGLERSGTDD
ncbi:MAG: tetratricopeptide repeat protein [Candidatus Eiseniibacteriota bacterium]|jgi:tetratricopeptide (TPR) repeat protein